MGGMFKKGGAPKPPDLPPPPPEPPKPQDPKVKEARGEQRRIAAASAMGAANTNTGAQGLEFTPANLIRKKIVLGG